MRNFLRDLIGSCLIMSLKTNKHFFSLSMTQNWKENCRWESGFNSYDPLLPIISHLPSFKNKPYTCDKSGVSPKDFLFFVQVIGSLSHAKRQTYF